MIAVLVLLLGGAAVEVWLVAHDLLDVAGVGLVLLTHAVSVLVARTRRNWARRRDTRDAHEPRAVPPPAEPWLAARSSPFFGVDEEEEFHFRRRRRSIWSASAPARTESHDGWTSSSEAARETDVLPREAGHETWRALPEGNARLLLTSGRAEARRPR